jgi:hypothetical protein
MYKRKLILTALILASFFSTGCGNSNTTNSINRATEYNSNVDNSKINNTPDKFFSNWEYGNVRSDKYNGSYNKK